MKYVFVALLVLWTVLLSSCPAGPSPGSGILSVSCTDNGSDAVLRGIHYSLDGGSEEYLPEGYTTQYWVAVGNHRLSGRACYWADPSSGIIYGACGDFDEQVYVWDAEYGETTWSH